MSEKNKPSSSLNTTSKAFTRRKLVTTAGIGAAAFFAGCSGDSGSDQSPSDTDTSAGGNDETTIEYWRWPHSTDPSESMENTIVEEFNEMDNGVHVEQVKTPTSDYQTKLKTAIGGNEAPSVAWSTDAASLYDPAGKSNEEVEQDAPYAYLGDLLDDSFLDQFWEPIWTQMQSNFKGIMGVPFVGALNPGLLYVNKDMWDEAGLGELPEDPWSFEEFHDALAAIDGIGEDTSAIGIGLQSAGRDWGTIAVKSRTTGKIIGEAYQNESDEYILTLADDQMVDGWNAWYGKPINEGWSTDPFSYTLTKLVEQFYAGRVGVLAHQTWARPGIENNADFEWDVLPYPTKNGESYWLREGGSIQMVAFKDDIGGKTEAAAKFLQFRNNAENHYRFFNETGQAIPNRAAYEMALDEGTSDYVEQTRGMMVMDRMSRAFDEMKGLGERRKEAYPDIKSQTVNGNELVEQGIPTGAGGGQITNSFKEHIQRMVEGTEPRDGFTTIEEEWQSALESDDIAVVADSVGFNSP